MRAALGFAAALALVGAAPVEPSAPPVSAQTILGRVRAAFHARPRPPYVIYTLARHDKLDFAPDFANSYTLRIWCRTSDNAALARRIMDGEAQPAQFIHPEFDKPIDPGPPTADIFAVLASHRASETPSPDASSPPVIGSVAVLIEFDYIATYAGIDAGSYHLVLVARRDPERNRLTDVYVDRETYALTHAVAHDHLYAMGTEIPERFEVNFGTVGVVPVITTIHGNTDYAAMTTDRGAYPYHETDYRFTKIEFPATLPGWYFDPTTYGAHRKDFPQ
jgi:hypothetical protein